MSKTKGSISGGSQAGRDYVKSKVEADFGDVEWTSSTWICTLIADCYFPNAQLDRAELGMDVNRFFQSFGGLRRLPHKVVASDFSDRALVRANDPKRLQAVWTAARRLYWSVYDVAPQFWQRQFTARTVLATCCVRAIAFAVTSIPEPSSSSYNLATWLAPVKPVNAATPKFPSN